MGFAVKRKNHRIGRSSDYLNIPKPIVAGKESTIAANRLILADPRGDIPENDLLVFMERHVEPAFWEWYESSRSEIGVPKNPRVPPMRAKREGQR